MQTPIVRRSKFADGQGRGGKGFNLAAFYGVLAEVVRARRTTWRSVSLDTGVPTATLKRMARGGYPDAAALAALSAWADLNPADFVTMQPNALRPRSFAAIAAVLRSDHNLDAVAVRDLEDIIKITYSHFREQYGERLAAL